jgi:hypothetical protein
MVPVEQSSGSVVYRYHYGTRGVLRPQIVMSRPDMRHCLGCDANRTFRVSVSVFSFWMLTLVSPLDFADLRSV